MILKLIGAFKVATWIFGIIGVVIFAMDPTLQVAIVVSIPLTITSIGTLVLGFLNRKKLAEIHDNTVKLEVSIDGKLSKLMETQGKLDHAEGRREGVDVTESKHKEQL